MKSNYVEFYLMRHAKPGIESSASSEFLSNPGLSEKGRIQAASLGTRLLKEDIKFDRIYTSPLKRAVETAEFACNAMRFPKENIILENNLTEIYDAEANMAETANHDAPKAFEWINDNFLSDSMHGARIGFFSHSHLIKMLLRKIAGFDEFFILKLNVDYAGISILRHSCIGWHIVTVNDCSHIHIQDRYSSFLCI